MNKFSTSFFSPNQSSQGGKSYAPTLTPVRVQDVIMDSSHPEYPLFGEEQSIGMIKYSDVNFPTTIKDSTLLPNAYMLQSNIKHFPLKNEIVLLVDAPSYAINSTKEAKSSNNIQYYTSIVNIWNDPNHSATTPGPNQKIDFGKTKFTAGQSVNPLQPYIGDILLQGRQGQSIRFAGSQHPKNTLTSDSNEGKPFTIIRNGQQTQSSDKTLIVEDIDKDPSGVWLTSDHIIPLTPSREKINSYKVPVTRPKDYKGSQVVTNADRIVTNARTSDILLSAAESFGVTSKTINLDGAEYATVDAPKVYLGERAMTLENQPVILGDSLEVFLNTLLTELESISDTLSTAKTVDQKPLPSVNLRGTLSKIAFSDLRSQIKPGGSSILKSKKVFTE